jgi:hypothetical protein
MPDRRQRTRHVPRTPVRPRASRLDPGRHCRRLRPAPARLRWWQVVVMDPPSHHGYVLHTRWLAPCFVANRRRAMTDQSERR